eukprot:403352977
MEIYRSQDNFQQTNFYDDEVGMPFRANLANISHSVRTTCTFCRKVTETIVKYETTRQQWYLCMCFFATGLVFLAPISFYAKGFYNAVHYCSQCAQFLGSSQQDQKVAKNNSENKAQQNNPQPITIPQVSNDQNENTVVTFSKNTIDDNQNPFNPHSQQQINLDNQHKFKESFQDLDVNSQLIKKRSATQRKLRSRNQQYTSTTNDQNNIEQDQSISQFNEYNMFSKTNSNFDKFNSTATHQKMPKQSLFSQTSTTSGGQFVNFSSSTNKERRKLIKTVINDQASSIINRVDSRTQQNQSKIQQKQNVNQRPQSSIKPRSLQNSHQNLFNRTQQLIQSRGQQQKQFQNVSPKQLIDKKLAAKKQQDYSNLIKEIATKQIATSAYLHQLKTKQIHQNQVIQDLNSEIHHKLEKEAEVQDNAQKILQEDKNKSYDEYVQKYLKYRRQLEDIKFEGESKIEQLTSRLNEKSQINQVNQRQLDDKKRQRMELEQQIANLKAESINYNEKLVLLKKSNTDYLDKMIREGCNVEKNADYIAQEQIIKIQKAENLKVQKEISNLRVIMKKSQDSNMKSKDYRSKLVAFMDSIIDSKILKKNDSQIEKECQFKDQAKKLINEAKQLFGINETKLKQQYKQ